ncbi:hypothetical protein Sm713_36100 [Streptomyces sp. TS71-3]|nr:hypothetical protein Sm713_36100 [Streptomyces sp. TS71-3]
MHWKRRWQALALGSALFAGAALTVASGPANAAQSAAAARVDNPYAGAHPYVNPEWSAHAAAEPGGSAVSDEATYVWLDRIAAIDGVGGAMGLRDHLDAAKAQGADLVQIVVHDLPGRDCAALASNGELGQDDLAAYESDYIDPIADILSDPAYASLRIAAVIEPDSLPNLVTNAGGQAGGTDACAEMLQNGNYVKGVGYALATLGALSNVYNYVDAGHHGWLGWDTNLVPFAQTAYEAATTSGATPADVAGFAVHTANYSALHEPYFSVTDTVAGASVRQSKWVDWNQYVDEQSFAQGLRQAAVSAGFDSGMLIDTSRNGWGGSARPTGPGASTSVDTYVNGGRIDRRIPPRQLVQPVRRRPRRAAGRGARVGHRRLRVDQAAGGVRRREPGHRQRRGQGLRPDVRPDLHGQRAQRQQPDRRTRRLPAGRALVLRAVPPAPGQRLPAGERRRWRHGHPGTHRTGRAAGHRHHRLQRVAVLDGGERRRRRLRLPRVPRRHAGGNGHLHHVHGHGPHGVHRLHVHRQGA